tara:strand:+ start:47 stop:604 length:558 start_codon:yes stop_codon:yes gene_type:complete
MKIISGKLKGSKLITPSGSSIRPTSIRAKEMIFNTLNSLISKENKTYHDLSVIDLFCGTGALGIEALSRGAKKSIFIDKSLYALKLCKLNCKKFDLCMYTEIIEMDIVKDSILNNFFNADLFFCDPPYEDFHTEVLIKKLGEFTTKGSIGVIELSKKSEIYNPKGFELITTKIVSNSKFYFLKAN